MLTSRARAGYQVSQRIFQKSPHFSKYQCPHCKLLLKKAVQPVCGHWLCQSCADELLAESSPPKCPRDDCNEYLKEDEDGSKYFPDRFVRREVEGMVVSCPNQDKGCPWEDKVVMLEAHLQTCNYLTEECKQCGQVLTSDQIETHARVCPKAEMKCPLVKFGCQHTGTMTREVMEQHVKNHGLEHTHLIAGALKLLQKQSTSTCSRAEMANDSCSQGFSDKVERDGPTEKPEKTKLLAVVHDPFADLPTYTNNRVQEQDYLSMTALTKISKELDSKISLKLKQKDSEILDLRSTITKLEKAMRTKHAEFEDRDFRLSLIENSNHDGSMIWKIPQFSQRMADAQTGRYTSIFSLPFHSGRYGYKMCLRLYILGDGIGKNTHMSLFFVVMKGEFDNILQWPFTHKVTFKLINQTGGRDIIDTFQPDPMSSSFRKPKSDMNIASGCPRFASHTELKNNGFILDDTIFIKCCIDTNSLRHP